MLKRGATAYAGAPPKERKLKMRKLTERQIKTQEKMKTVRIEDGINLREKIKGKLIWVAEEKKKGINLIEQRKKEILSIENQITLLIGAEKALNDVLKNDTKEAE